MKLVVQKVNYCKLSVDGKLISEINAGLLVLTGVHRDDTEIQVEYLAKKISQMRIFKDEFGKLNKSVLDINGDVMVVSNFTLLAEIISGTRPNFSQSAKSEQAIILYKLLAEEFKKNGVCNVMLGAFGEHMHLDCDLDGPCTIVIEK